tara:strand:- start:134667 stop:135644 length:978 start_codon:yes stop_codon:yes gene_type:complete
MYYKEKGKGMSEDILSDLDENDDVLIEDSNDINSPTASVISTLVENAKRHPLLTAEQEVELSKQKQSSNPLVVRAAIDKFIVSNILLVVKIAKKFSFNEEEEKEFIQEGFLGLYRAAEKYEGDRGFRFSTYATWWIRQSIQRRSYNFRRVINIPNHFEKRLVALRKLKRELRRDPDVDEIMAHIDISKEQVEELLAFSDVKLSLSQDNEQEDMGPLVDRVVSDSEGAEATSLREDANQYLDVMLANALTARERKVIEMRFGKTCDKMTLEDVGESMSITRERVRQIESKALRKLAMYARNAGISKTDLLLVNLNAERNDNLQLGG